MRYITSIKEKLSILEECIQSFLDKVSLPKLNENQTLKCEGAETVAQTCSVKKVSATLLKKRL